MRKAKYFFRFVIVAGAMFGLFFGVGAGLANFLHGSDTTVAAGPGDGPGEEETVQEERRTNILVLGVDARPGDDHSRSDTIMLVSIDPKLNKAAFISIPRDTRVDIPGSPFDKINAANYVGGPKMSVRMVEDLLDINIDNYVEMDFKGFKSLVDILGGVTINVPQRMYKPSEDIDLRPGEQRLNGRQALAFVRYRDYVMGDIDRTGKQQMFIKALAQEVLKPSSITKLPKLAKEGMEYVDTDLTFKDVVKLISWMPGFSTESIVTQTLPGSFYDQRDQYGNLTASYWEIDQTAVTDLIDNLFSGQNLAVIKQNGYQELNANKQVQQTSNQTETVANDPMERANLPSPGHE
jgi:LCP family protein required for cell wall assembly